MADLLDYVCWRGDLSFRNSPLNEVDALILCQLSYMNFSGIISDSFLKKDRITLREAAAFFAKADDYEERSNVGALINSLSVTLLEKCGKSERFGSLSVCGFVNKIDFDNEEQFSAVTFGFGKQWHFIAYRGTDDTIIGWKEDFNLGYMDSVPAQEDALVYLEQASLYLSGPLYLGGHSKGGNLAVYAGAESKLKVQKRIKAVFNNDGPGFAADFFKTPGYSKIASIVHTYVPRLSVVGMLFENAGDFVTVENDQKNMLMQHDPFSWHVNALSLVKCEGLGDESKFIGKTINEWVSTLTTEEKRLFIEVIFTLLESTNAKTNYELKNNWFDSLLSMKKSLDAFSPETKEAVKKNIQLLMKIMIDEFTKDKLPNILASGNS